ncbi:unnamed protein product [Plutella xylostella]|uniref:(diamondback moth) hypothetical protein n=1 Tax=Plutella xylostella TaxID=51655 RepID=A0A8S4DEE7_PLUXY|nr:unnamed protein product [Plutella xylostella]
MDNTCDVIDRAWTMRVSGIRSRGPAVERGGAWRAHPLPASRRRRKFRENVTGSGSGSGGSAGEAADAAAHTFGPLDGSIYATVVRAGGGPSSPLSASMDSGISSAGRRAAPSPPDELDALLGDMLRTVSALPDAPQSRAGRQPDIPYHARADSAPFTYGTAGLSPGMLRAPHRLASPELVRRALGRPGYRPIDDDDEPPPPSPRPQHATLKKFTHEDVTTTTSPQTITNGRWLNGETEWAERPPSRQKTPENGTWRSNSTLGWQESSRLREPRRSEGSNEGSGLTWLQRQQQKLREKREARERVQRLPLEWDAPSRHVRRSASHRMDGYTSDTTAFADDDDDFSVPLHVNTRAALRTDSLSPQAPDRTSSRKFMYEQKMVTREWSTTSTPNGSTTPGLLSLAEPINGNDTLSLRERSESWSRSESRAGTPLFPTHPRTPYPPTPTPSVAARPPRSPPVTRKERETSPESEYRIYAGAGSRRSSVSSELQHVAPDRVRFARDTSHYWYKPSINRDDEEHETSPESEYRIYAGAGSRRSSVSSELQHVAPDRVRFARDTSHYWYKPSINRDDEERETSPESEYRIYAGAGSRRSSVSSELQHVAPDRVRFAWDTSHYWYKPSINRDDEERETSPESEYRIYAGAGSRRSSVSSELQHVAPDRVRFAWDTSHYWYKPSINRDDEERETSPESEYRIYAGAGSRRSSVSSELQHVAPDRVRFARDTSHYWYKPSINRDDEEHETSPESEYRIYAGAGSRRSSVSSELQHVAPDRVRFARDTSHYWYKPSINRDDEERETSPESEYRIYAGAGSRRSSVSSELQHVAPDRHQSGRRLVSLVSVIYREERETSPESEYRIYAGAGSRRSSVSSELQHVAPDRVRFARDTSHYWYKPSINRDDERETSPESEYRIYAGAGSRRSSVSSELQHVAPDRVRFARDTSHYWYKPSINRDDAISALQNLEEGSFIVRDSNSFPGAFGLAVRASGGVRHFLIEPTSKGVRLRGCPDEPVFGSLSALVYQHTVTPLALPVPLRLPDRDPWTGGNTNAAARALLATGAACHVLLLGSENTEALTGPAAVKRAVTNVLMKKGQAYVVHFKVFGGGITLTDNARKLFFRRHYPAAGVSYAGLDPDERRYQHNDNGAVKEKRVFAFVARLTAGCDNQCHVFAELEPEQPATAIVNFVNKALLGNSQKRDIL